MMSDDNTLAPTQSPPRGWAHAGFAPAAPLSFATPDQHAGFWLPVHRGSHEACGAEQLATPAAAAAAAGRTSEHPRQLAPTQVPPRDDNGALCAHVEETACMSSEGAVLRPGSAASSHGRGVHAAGVVLVALESGGAGTVQHSSNDTMGAPTAATTLIPTLIPTQVPRGSMIATLVPTLLRVHSMRQDTLGAAAPAPSYNYAAAGTGAGAADICSSSMVSPCVTRALARSGRIDSSEFAEDVAGTGEVESPVIGSYNGHCNGHENARADAETEGSGALQRRKDVISQDLDASCGDDDGDDASRPALLEHQQTTPSAGRTDEAALRADGGFISDGSSGSWVSGTCPTCGYASPAAAAAAAAAASASEYGGARRCGCEACVAVQYHAGDGDGNNTAEVVDGALAQRMGHEISADTTADGAPGANAAAGVPFFMRAASMPLDPEDLALTLPDPEDEAVRRQPASPSPAHVSVGASPHCDDGDAATLVPPPAEGDESQREHAYAAPLPSIAVDPHVLLFTLAPDAEHTRGTIDDEQDDHDQAGVSAPEGRPPSQASRFAVGRKRARAELTLPLQDAAAKRSNEEGGRQYRASNGDHDDASAVLEQPQDPLLVLNPAYRGNDADDAEMADGKRKFVGGGQLLSLSGMAASDTGPAWVSTRPQGRHEGGSKDHRGRRAPGAAGVADDSFGNFASEVQAQIAARRVRVAAAATGAATAALPRTVSELPAASGPLRAVEPSAIRASSMMDDATKRAGASMRRRTQHQPGASSALPAEAASATLKRLPGISAPVGRGSTRTADLPGERSPGLVAAGPACSTINSRKRVRALQMSDWGGEQIDVTAPLGAATPAVDLDDGVYHGRAHGRSGSNHRRSGRRRVSNSRSRSRSRRLDAPHSGDGGHRHRSHRERGDRAPGARSSSRSRRADRASSGGHEAEARGAGGQDAAGRAAADTWQSGRVDAARVGPAGSGPGSRSHAGGVATTNATVAAVATGGLSRPSASGGSKFALGGVTAVAGAPALQAMIAQYFPR